MLASKESLKAACVAGLAVLALGMGEPAIDPTLEEILRHQLEYFNGISSLDYAYLESNAGGGIVVPGEVDWSKPSAESGRIRSQDGMWRGDLKLTDAGPTEAFAYDGDRYQRYRTSSSIRMLDVRRSDKFGVPYGQVPPTLRPFFFAYDESSLDGYSALKDEQTWRNAFQELSARVLSESERVGNEECTVVEMTWPTNVRGRICFAKDKGFFPVSVEMFMLPGNQRRSVTAVEELTEIRTESGTVYVPTKIKLDSWRQDNGELMGSRSWELDNSSIRVNQRLDSADFAISHALLTHYNDRDNPDESYFVPDPSQYLLSGISKEGKALGETLAASHPRSAVAPAKNTPTPAKPPTRSAAPVQRNWTYGYVFAGLFLLTCAGLWLGRKKRGG